MPVTCKICNQEFKSLITNTHLKKHEMTTAQYIEQFGKEALSSQEYRDKKSQDLSGENNPNFGNTWSDTQKTNLSEKNKGKTAWNKGIPCSDPQKTILSEKALERNTEWRENGNHPLLGRTLDIDVTTKISNSIKEYAANNPVEMSERAYKAIETKLDQGVDLAFFRGKTHSPQTKEKISEKGLGRTHSPQTKEIMKEKARETAKKRIQETNQQYLDRVLESSLSLLSDINDYYMKLQCNICKYIFTRTRQIFQKDKNRIDICPECYPMTYTQSLAEMEIFDYIHETFNGTVLGDDRNAIYPLELDIYIPDLKIAFEYCGLYWHSESMGKDKNYHLYKHRRCEENGIQLITIFEDEYVKNKDIVLSRIDNILKKTTTKIPARKCQIKEIIPKECNEFLNNNHLQGSGRSKIRYGLFYKAELVSVMSFSDSNITRKQAKDVWEINRFCSKINCVVIGGANRLFKAFIRDHSPQTIISYADKRWSAGNLYKILGFEQDKDTQPNYWYMSDYTKRIHRFALRKTKDDQQLLTEWENRKLQGYDRIWDCGSTKWMWKEKI